MKLGEEYIMHASGYVFSSIPCYFPKEHLQLVFVMETQRIFCGVEN
jgi:hypothetical protein